MILTVESFRRDGKYMVRFEYPGGPNAFGGHYPGRIFRKIMAPAQLVEQAAKPGVDAVHGMPIALSREVGALKAARLVGAA